MTKVARSYNDNDMERMGLERYGVIGVWDWVGEQGKWSNVSFASAFVLCKFVD